MNDSEAIRAARKGLEHAFDRADPDAAAAFLTVDFIGMPPNQPSVAVREAAHNWWTEGFRVASSRLESSSVDLQALGDWAIERFTSTLETEPVSGGPRATDKGKGLWIWRRHSDGSWKLAQAIFNSENSPPGT